MVNIELVRLSPRHWPAAGSQPTCKKFTGKFVYMAHHFILLQLNLFDLRVDREGWWFEHCIMVAGFLVSRRC